MAHPIEDVAPDAIGAATTAQLDAGIDAWLHLAEALREPELSAQVRAAGEALVSSLAAGGKVLVAGNGGSAAIASHVAAEFIGKCIHDRHPLPAISLAESHSSLTAIGNDYGFDQVFLRGVQAFGRPGDVFLAMSTSGTSPNVVAALAEARSRGLATILMTGSKGAGQADLADHLLVVPSSQTPRIQEVHMLWAHAWCEAVDLVMQDAP